MIRCQIKKNLDLHGLYKNTSAMYGLGHYQTDNLVCLHYKTNPKYLDGKYPLKKKRYVYTYLF